MKSIAKFCLIGLLSISLALPALAGEKETVIFIGEDGEVRVVGEEAEGAWLGVTLSGVDEEMAEEAGLRKAEGAMVQSVYDDTPAESAGLEAGDIIVEFDGEKVKDVGALVTLVHDHAPGDEVKIKARRDGKRKSFRVTLGEREQSFTLKGDLHGGDGPHRFFMKQMDAPHRIRGKACLPGKASWTFSSDGMPGQAKLGVEIRDLEGELASYFPGTKEGALVLSVIEDSAAEAAGLKAGDVIIKLGGETVDDAADLRAAVAEAAGEGELELVYYRQGKRRDTEVEIAEGGIDIAVGRLSRFFEEGGEGLHEVFEQLHDEDWSEKLEQMEERLQELEERLEKKFGKDE
jgi:serine protease Do